MPDTNGQYREGGCSALISTWRTSQAAQHGGQNACHATAWPSALTVSSLRPTTLQHPTMWDCEAINSTQTPTATQRLTASVTPYSPSSESAFLPQSRTPIGMGPPGSSPGRVPRKVEKLLNVGRMCSQSITSIAFVYALVTARIRWAQCRRSSVPYVAPYPALFGEARRTPDHNRSGMDALA